MQVPKIKELKQICFKKNSDSQYWFPRKFSIYLTWLFLHTRIKPNTLTMIWVILGLIGAFLISIGNYYISLVGLAFFLIGRVIDYCDGEVARAKKIFSEKGEFLDIAGSHVIYLLLMLAIMINIYRTESTLINSNFILILIGSLTIIGYSLKELIPYIYQESYKNIKDNKEIRSKIYKSYRVFRKISLVEYFSTVLTITLLIDLPELFLIWYSIIFNLLWIGKVSYEVIK